jgi:hypothetical protein
MAEYGGIDRTLDAVTGVEQAVDRVERIVKEYSKPIERLNKAIGGFGIGLTKFGSLNAKLEALNDRLELEQKQTKQLLGFQMRFENVLKSNKLKPQLDKFGPKILGDTIQDALAAGGPALADQIDLGAMLTSVGKDPAKMFEFIKDFRVISGFNADQQKSLISSLKKNFSRQDQLISALGELTATLQATAQVSPEISKNIVSLMGDLTSQFPGLEQQFGDFFKTFLSDPNIGRGYLGVELANAQKTLVGKLIEKNATKEDLLGFIDLIANSPELKARQNMTLGYARATGQLQDAIVLQQKMQGDLAAKAKSLSSAIKTTEGLQKDTVVPEAQFVGGELEKSIINQLDITLDKINSSTKLTRDDFFKIQEYAAKIGADLTFSLDQLKGTLQETAESVNKTNQETITKIREQEEILSDLYTKYSIGRDIFDTTKGAIDTVVDMFRKAKEAKDAMADKLGSSCDKPMYVVMCDEAAMEESKKKSEPDTKKGWWETIRDLAIFKWLSDKGGVVLEKLKGGWGKMLVGLKSIVPWFKGLTPLLKTVVVAGVLAIIGIIFALINAMLDVGGTASTQQQRPVPRGIDYFDDDIRVYKTLREQRAMGNNVGETIKEFEEGFQLPDTKEKFYEFLKNEGINQTTIAPARSLSEEEATRYGEVISDVLEKKLNNTNFVAPENESIIAAIFKLKEEVSIVSKTLIDVKSTERYNPELS